MFWFDLCIQCEFFMNTWQVTSHTDVIDSNIDYNIDCNIDCNIDGNVDSNIDSNIYIVI